MGTRGLFGFYYQGKFYLVHNHLDSYPTGMGKVWVQEIISILIAGKLYSEWLDKVVLLEYSEDEYDKTESFEELLAHGKIFNPWFTKWPEYREKRMKQWQLPFDPVDTEYAYIVNYETKELDLYWFPINSTTERYEQKSLPLEITVLNDWCRIRSKSHDI